MTTLPDVSPDDFKLVLRHAVADYKKLVAESSAKKYNEKWKCAERATRRWLLHHQMALRMARVYQSFIRKIEDMSAAFSNLNDPVVGRFAAGNGEPIVEIIMTIAEIEQGERPGQGKKDVEELTLAAHLCFGAAATMADMLLGQTENR